jgi:hypothetical protein
MVRAVIVILVLVLGGAMGSATAQTAPCAPQFPEQLAAWRWAVQTYDGWRLREQPKEALRIGDNPSVLRHLDRLYLVIDGGHRLIHFVDCPDNKAALAYLYQHDDEIGRFYVISQIVHEDGPRYLLVSKRDGAVTEVFGPPVWSPDRSRVVAGHCAAGPGVMSIVGVAQDELRPEATFELPCDAGHCELTWEDPSTVLAACGGGARNLRVVGKGAAWSVVPGSDPGAQMPRP